MRKTHPIKGLALVVKETLDGITGVGKVTVSQKPQACKGTPKVKVHSDGGQLHITVFDRENGKRNVHARASNPPVAIRVLDERLSDQGVTVTV